MKPNFTYNKHIEEVQRQLGFTGKDLDGKRGTMTMEAVIEAMDEGRVEIPPPARCHCSAGGHQDYVDH